ncbi:oxygen sensor histidine kinase NreB [Kordia sp. SMS9]|uniref:tetratricopeptide repeat-containing sensor histidine kinase n=1 Tax=Kordia sp. SMS9 TaxID=2282170 RepID=UPI000E100FCC|nr:sensor histidine kinase [Kordia sp. SMS9]AXG71318.1 oxygen sensor histidine kinase NreB [Kordia sp. SMS9]
MKKISLIIVCIICNFSFGQENFEDIYNLLTKSKSKDLNNYEKKAFIDKAFNRAKSLEEEDPAVGKLFLDISTHYTAINDTLLFRKSINKSKYFSQKNNDSITLARSYWKLGNFLVKNKKSDSAYSYYYNAKEQYDDLDMVAESASMLLNMAIIQRNGKDYTGSEITTTEAIKIFKKLKQNNRLYSCYNNLGIIHNNLEEYEKAIDYHNSALEYLKKTKKNSLSEAATLNNIGVVYRNQGNHLLAVKNYLEGLKYDSLFMKNPRLYATLTDNLAYSKFKLNDTKDLPYLFDKALKIRDSLDISAGIIINKLHLSEFYLDQNDTLKSQKYSMEAMRLAKKTNALRDLLASFKLLAKINPNDDSKYLNEYIRINDSLVKHERSLRDKFTRIQYETDAVRNQNEKLSLQNTWIVAISTAIIFFGFLIYVITQQRTRNKELEMEQQQQRANEEIYNLMIDQQDKIEEGRKREKERISLELHDGILGRLFGTRLSLGSLNAKDDANSKRVREQYINELQSIEEEVRNISHELGLDNFDKSTSYSTMITNLLEEQSKITNFKYQIEDDDRILWTDIPGHIKINIYRIIQESIQNINKYAQAENVILDFKKSNDRIILSIKDDGVGFDQSKRSSGIGLKNMKSRVTLLHGQFTINSIPGKGTSISVDVPMT